MIAGSMFSLSIETGGSNASLEPVSALAIGQLAGLSASNQAIIIVNEIRMDLYEQ
jgi:hypothetical protein